MSKSSIPLESEEAKFAAAAEKYLRMLRTKHPEHFMEAKPQARQREITVESFALAQLQKELDQLRQENAQLRINLKVQTERAKAAEDELAQARAELERLRRRRNGA